MLPNTSLTLELFCEKFKKLITHFILMISLQEQLLLVFEALLFLYPHPPFVALNAFLVPTAQCPALFNCSLWLSLFLLSALTSLPFTNSPCFLDK
ncbi:hypothetical protein Tco_0002571 [Tanacetum coccineum]